jgi:hypothetical protein
LTLTERLESVAHDAREVNEEVIALVVAGEAKALGVVEETDNCFAPASATRVLATSDGSLATFKASNRARRTLVRSARVSRGCCALSGLARREVPRAALAHPRRRGLRATLGRAIVQSFRGDRVVDGA